MSSDLLDLLKQQGAEISATTDGHMRVVSFGNDQHEIGALQASAVVCPLLDHICIRAVGKDRAKFLHNFCTNNVKDLESGQSCEAFFCDVKAKILAHGYILAGKEFHEIHMLPGNENTLLDHLNRYIITEDVALTSLSARRTTFVVAGPQTQHVAGMLSGTGGLSASGCHMADNVTIFRTTWNDLPVAFVSVNDEDAVETWHQFTSTATAAGESTFHHLRILERYPMIGTDLTSDHLAPEAARDSVAISYTKGCYLGQEPIARLDAMGHINRRLYQGWATTADDSQDDKELPTVTSQSMVADTSFPVMLPLSVKLATNSSPLIAKIADGPIVHVDRLK